MKIEIPEILKLDPRFVIIKPNKKNRGSHIYYELTEEEENTLMLGYKKRRTDGRIKD